MALAFNESLALLLSAQSALWTTAFFLIGILSAYFTLRALAREFKGKSACAACPLRKKCGNGTGDCFLNEYA